MSEERYRPWLILSDLFRLIRYRITGRNPFG